jgi:hypothetical protein
LDSHYFDIQTTTINHLRKTIRYAKDHDNPQLLSFWLAEELILFSESDCKQDIEAKCRIYEGQCRLLLDTISDTLIPEHWRELCLNHIHLPLINLERISLNEAMKNRVHILWLALKMTVKF